MCSLVVALTPIRPGATPKVFSKDFLHLGNVRRHLRHLRNNHRVHVVDGPAGFSHALGALPHDDHAVEILELHVAGRVVLSDVAERRRAQQRIRDGMRQHIRVAVAFQADLVRDFHATDNALAPRGKPMHVDSNANTVHRVWKDNITAAGEAMLPQCPNPTAS